MYTFVELYTNPDQWAQTREKIDMLGYADHVLGNTYSDEEPEAGFAAMREWGIPLALEVGAVKEWGITGIRTYMNEKSHWERFVRLGADLQAICFDEPLVAVEREQFDDVIGDGDRMAYAVQETTNFIKVVRNDYPDLMMGDIEAFPYFDADYIIEWIDALEKSLADNGMAGMDFFRLDVDWNAFGKNPGVRKRQWEEVKRIEDHCKEIGLPFSMIYWASDVAGSEALRADESSWYNSIMQRQFLYGKRYFLKEFGQEIRNLWMPDVFGYSGALPQIMKKAGVDYFMTTKLAFNEFTRFPHHTFLWEGIDGTRVLTHMLPEGTYNGPMTPRSIKHAERNYQERGICEEGLILYGVGDGGGPGEEHIERMHRMRNLDGLCPMKHGFAQDLFERLDEHRDRYDVYKGELYFERHQGTYTTQCKNKWFNRKLEFAFHNLEFLLAMLRPDDYPAQELEKMWKEFLLYQFHDILPGSSINRVYDESVAGYQKIADRLEEMTREACAQLGDGPVAVNALSWDRSDLVQAGGRTMKVSAPALSAQAAVLEEVDVSALRAEGLTLENEALRVRFSEDGSIASVYSKTLGRETLREGTAGNRL